MNCMKLLGQKLMARDFDRQTAELRVRIAILNRFTATLDILTRALDGIASTQRHQQQQTQDRNRCTLHAFLLESP